MGRASRWAVAGAVALGVALRVAHVLALRQTPFFDHLVVDPQFYDAWAQRIAAGDWLGDRPFYMDPLYPYVLGVWYRVVGHDLLRARLLNVAFSAGACVLVARLGRQVGGARVAVLAAFGFALYRPELFYVGEVDKTSLSMLLGAAALTLALDESVAAGFGAGAATAATALTRANVLVFVPALALVDGWRRRPRRALAVLAGAAVILLPVGWRNHHVAGEWVLTTTQAGQNFYTGNNETNPYGAYGVVPFVRPNPSFEEAAFAHMAADPAFAARAFGRKLLLFWNDFEISDSQDQYLLARFSPVLRLPLLDFGTVAPLALLGAVAWWRRSRAVRLLVGVAAVYCVTLVAFFLFSRYRLPVVLALLPLAALGATELWARLRARRRLVAAAALVAAGALVCHLRVGVFQPDHPVAVALRLGHLADAQLQVGQVDAAIATLHESVARCPGCAWTLQDLFETYRTTGRTADGAAWFEGFARAHPEQRDAAGYLAELRAAR
jgi:4-amino-4-deoxy-L-arabinose transferase-like glycosyltransferase